MEKVYNPYDNVLKIVKEAADILGYTDSDIEAIKYPERELKVAIPVRMDDGTTKVFEGYRVQHSTSRGPAKAESVSIRQSILTRSGPWQLDDIQVRSGEHSLRRRQGRRCLRPQ